MLDNITFVIPTYKRYSHLKRLLKFYNSYNLHSHFLILDSSPFDPQDETLLRMLNAKNVTWKRYDKNIFFARKVSDGCRNISTDYAVLNADDDFIIPGSIEKCIEKLTKNLDLSSVYGYYFHHSSYENSKKSKFSIGRIYKGGKGAMQESARDRMVNYLNGGVVPPFYSVQKSNIFKLIWNETGKFTSMWGLGEILPCCLTLIYGKVELLPIFFASREPNDYQFVDNEMSKQWYSEDRIKKATKCIAQHLSKVENISIHEAEKIFRKNIGTFEDFEIAEKIAQRFWKKYFLSLRNKLGIRTRLRQLFFNGCYPIIYKEQYNDYIRVKDSVISSRLLFEDLNESRIDYKK